MIVVRIVTFLLLAAILPASLAACGGSATPGPRPTSSPSSRFPLIKHIVIVVQENRTVDNLFNGLPGADTVTSGKNHLGQVVNFHQTELENAEDTCHGHQCWAVTYDNGNLDGFDLNHPRGTSTDYDYAFVDPAETVPYFTLAKTYTFADRNFQTNSGPSYPWHEYMIAGTSLMVDENIKNNNGFNGWGCDSPSGAFTLLLGSDGQDHPGPFPCFDYQTLADEMDTAGVSWRYYAPAIGTGNGAIWSGFDAVRHIRYGPDWNRNVISPETKFLSDIAAGTLAEVTWIVPKGANSDHPGSDKTGPAWVASVVNAIGTSPFWNTTAIFVTWDDWGGWYDHVNPPQLDSMGLGYRTPLIVVSPYAKLHYISHVQHELGSIMKFQEETFVLPPLGQVEARADDLSDCFDFTQSPTPFVPIPSSLRPSYFLTQAASIDPPDSE